ncbi:HupE/UreJ family protein [Croceibacterium aestuarii]|uniref:HupE/UreJ family protein n=1 Tax=Croceibacterium aestuarii TaxID=3064139 RepID=UPI00272ECD7B|nr:HupE/UreJ family protein [Croceibacterium sp. D39]
MIRFLWLALLLALIPGAARADDNRPLAMTLDEGKPGEWDMRWRVPANLAAHMVPEASVPDGCEALGPSRRWSDALGYWGGVRFRCGEPLAGKSIALAYPRSAPPLATIARLHPASGAEETILAQPGELAVAIPAHPAEENLFLRFLRLGVEHIWTGIDHLLFVAGLIFIAGTWRRTAVTITGFTISHSITLALAALGLMTFPPGAVEAVIALSIVFLAVEIAKGPRDTLTWRRPVFVAMSFGLLHGFGFAAVLGQIGLPKEGLVTALLAFNLGIELGQVIFAALVFAMLHVLARLPALGNPHRVQRIAAYCVGILASYWMFDRIN